MALVSDITLFITPFQRFTYTNQSAVIRYWKAPTKNKRAQATNIALFLYCLGATKGINTVATNIRIIVVITFQIYNIMIKDYS